MLEHEAIDIRNESVIILHLIKPKFKTTSSCFIPLYMACELARANEQNPEVVKQKATEEKEGILATNEYLPGDFVLMDQYIVKTPGRLLTGYG